MKTFGDEHEQPPMSENGECRFLRLTKIVDDFTEPKDQKEAHEQCKQAIFETITGNKNIDKTPSLWQSFIELKTGSAPIYHITCNGT